jgi:hypothetical protein
MVARLYVDACDDLAALRCVGVGCNQRLAWRRSARVIKGRASASWAMRAAARGQEQRGGGWRSVRGGDRSIRSWVGSGPFIGTQVREDGPRCGARGRPGERGRLGRHGLVASPFFFGNNTFLASNKNRKKINKYSLESV